MIEFRPESSAGPSTPQVSVILATSGLAPTIDEQLKALATQIGAPAFEVVLVANRAGPSAENVRKRWESKLHLRLVRADQKSGLSYARNVGIAQALGSKLVFVDDDDVVSTNYLQAMTLALDDYPAVGARIDLIALNPGWRSEVRDVPQTTLGAGELETFAYGATLGVRREVLEHIGPFDEALDGIAGEDVDWCQRLRATGARIGFVPDAVVHYRLRTRYRDLYRQGYRYGRGGQIVSPSWSGWRPWLHSVAGPLRLFVFGGGKGTRRRGAFLLGRRLGTAAERRPRR